MRLYLVHYATPDDCLSSGGDSIYEEAEPSGFVVSSLDTARARVLNELNQRLPEDEQEKEWGCRIRDCVWTDNNELMHGDRVVAVLSYREQEV
jgi:hypothetical protein